MYPYGTRVRLTDGPLGLIDPKDGRFLKGIAKTGELGTIVGDLPDGWLLVSVDDRDGAAPVAPDMVEEVK